MNSEFVVLEISTIPYNDEAPLFDDVVAFMASAGYVVFDICDRARRQTDDVRFQVDVLFARATSALRGRRKFWLNEP